MKSAGAEAVFVAYPYGAAYLEPSRVMAMLRTSDTPAARQRAEELIAQTKAWMLAMNAKLAHGVRICVREDTHKSLFDYFAAYPNRPMWIYWELTHYTRSNYPLIPTGVRCIGAGYSPNRPNEDILWANDIDYNWFSEPVKVAACEYAWNTRFPGWSEFEPEYRESGEPEVGDQAALDIIAERAAVGFWGAEAGEFLKDIFRHHLSWRVAADPKETTKRLPANLLPPLLRRNQDAARIACEAMDRFWEKQKGARAAGQKIIDDFSYPFFVQFYAMTKAAKAYADVHSHEFEALEKIQGGDADGAASAIAEGRKELAAAWQDYGRTITELRNEFWVVRREELPKGWERRPEGMLIRPDFASLELKLQDLQSNYKGLSSPAARPKQMP